MALRFPAKKKPKPQKPAAHPDPHVSMGDEGQDEAASQETFHLELDLHPEELSLLKKLSDKPGHGKKISASFKLPPGVIAQGKRLVASFPGNLVTSQAIP